MALPDWLKKLATYGSVLRSFDANGNERLTASGESFGIITLYSLMDSVFTADGSIKTSPTTASAKEAHNVSAPTGAADADAAETALVQAGDVVVRSFAEQDVDGVSVYCRGGAGFAGLYIVCASSDIGIGMAATRLTGSNDNADQTRIFCPKDTLTLIPFADLQYLYMIAMDVDGSENNHANIYPV